MPLTRKIRLSLGILLSILVFGTAGLVWTEHMTVFQALYLTVETITTVGYGDFRLTTSGGRIVTLLLMLGGVGIMLYSVGLFMSFLIEGQLIDVYGRRVIMKKIAELNQHIIICGGGRVGKEVAHRLHKEGVPCVVIEQREELVVQLCSEGILTLQGDAIQDEMLKTVRIEQAAGLISALPDDAHNVFITLTAKELNPMIKVIARMDTPGTEAKLRRAGADKVISPSIMGGLRMAMSIIKPTTVDYIDTVIHDQSIKIEIEELKIGQGSYLAGKTLRNSGIREYTGTTVLAIVRENEVINNPGADVLLMEEDLLIIFGLKEQLQQVAVHTK